ncbi:MAG TPA: flotillin domain-containing protein [Gammaproteobacteria bacterium]
MDNVSVILFYAGISLVGLLGMGLILARLYRRSSKQISFVRTGFGGQKVIMNGGALVLPVLHEIIPVNMNTLRLEVVRASEAALITRDRMRVDVQAEFYVRVQPTVESIANAAQTLGMRTMEPAALKELVEGKFVDALRAVAAEMAMIELHEMRVDFVQKVQQVVSEDLLKNGLELESVSLTGLDQTSKEYFNPDNAFDAEGLTKLTEAIEERRKRRNEIEQDAEVSIARKNLEADKQKLEVGREQEYARMEQEREISIRRAAQEAEIAREQAEKKREAEQAEIIAAQQTEQARITSDRAVEQERIKKERELRELDIAKARALETAEIEKVKSVEQAEILAVQQTEQARIASERAVEEERIKKERELRELDIAKARALETADIEKIKSVELAQQDRAVAVANKSREQSEAEAEAAQARAKKVQADEAVITVKESEVAERDKRIELIEAAKEAERQAIKLKVAAEAEKAAAEDHAEAVRIAAQGNADRLRLEAEGQAEAAKLAALAAEERYRVDAAGKRALNEAANLLAAEQIAREIRLALIERLPQIIAESVKPMEQIDAIKIFQIDGLHSGTSSGEGGTAPSSGNLADQVVNSALRYRAQAPLVESLLNEVGLKGDSLAGLTAQFMGEGGPAADLLKLGDKK